MHLELPTLITESRVRIVGSYMYIPEVRSVGVGDRIIGEVFGRVEPYQNISRG